MRLVLFVLIVCGAGYAHQDDIGRAARAFAPEKSLLSTANSCGLGRGLRRAPPAIPPAPVASTKKAPVPTAAPQDDFLGLTKSLGIPDLICDSPSTGFKVEYEKATSSQPKSRITVTRNGEKKAEYSCVEGDASCGPEFTEYWSDLMASVFEFAKEPARIGFGRLPAGVSCRPR